MDNIKNNHLEDEYYISNDRCINRSKKFNKRDRKINHKSLIWQEGYVEYANGDYAKELLVDAYNLDFLDNRCYPIFIPFKKSEFI